MAKSLVCTPGLRNREAKRELNVMWNGTRLSNTTTSVYLGVHLDRTLCYKTHTEKTKMKVNARNNIIRKHRKLEVGVQGIDTQTQLSRPLLLSCRIRLPCVGKIYTRAQAEPGPKRLLPNHIGLPQTNELGQCTPTGRYRPSSHQEDCCLPHGTHPDTNCSITNQLIAVEVAEELHAHSHAARLVCKLERQPHRRASLPPSKWDWVWPSICRLDLERTGSVAELLLTDGAQGWAVRKQ